jgi:linoleoyl-CoA desaturase
VRSATAGAPESVFESLAALRREFARRGFDRKATGRVLVELAAHLALVFGGLALVVLAEPVWQKSFGMLVAVFGTMGVASNTHTSSHYGTSDRRWVNELLTFLGLPLFLNLSATYWREKHITLHHKAPNVLGVDEDIDLAPWFALTEADRERGGALARAYYRVQWLAVPFALAGNGFQMQVASWRHVLSALFRGKRRRSAHWIDLAALAAHWGLWIGLPLLFLPALQVLVIYGVRICLMGYVLFAVLAPAHFPSEAVCVRTGEEDEDFVRRQAAATVNFRGGLLARFLCSGLDYQIEHHLFPAYSHVYYSRMSPLVREFCERRGYPYRSFGWGRALVKTYAVFWRPKPVA